ncbi:unknown [Acetobacter sp. CAG:977]|nr:unknown [Acetobacter sp. CAG:977]
MNFPEGKDVTEEYKSVDKRNPCSLSAEYMEKLKEKVLSKKDETNDERPEN